MLLVNIDIRNRLINGQTGNIRQAEFPQGSVRKVYVNFSNEQTGLKPMRLSYLRRQNIWIPIEKCEIEISIKKGPASPSIKRIQFPLPLAWTSTVHRVQDLNLEKGVVYFICISKNRFGLGKYIPRSAG